ncbi:SsgA family sporulation/cell division regulator [Streptomyces purpurogeneiscleroticus]|uniref:SsgA family sporulation/cell division regulator n=1 Tax=Streptomyces purpurogeneiscleroticus TaxID=68259 RepID=UPI001CBFC616|nr:SsgA family sporulation/cell division regulator [Streptomyces purpurogeneiscleroticus]MBZ4014873.1 regulator [Streptomyces purpurogeneiscleroticus]
MPDIIDHAVQAGLIATAPQSRAVLARLRYKSTDPFAVQAIFPAAASLDGAEVRWTFGRDLLAAGLLGPAGEGDVHAWPCGPRHTMLEFHAADGMAMVRFASADLRRFLASAYLVVPRGAEPRLLDVDADLAALLREA